MSNSTVRIRAATEADLPILTQEVRPEYGRTNMDDLRDQQAGLLTFVTAWLQKDGDETFVGAGFVMWTGPRRIAVYERYPRCPEICRLGVKPEYRSQGIGTQMLEACETEAKDRGFVMIGLGVSVENPGADRLYTRLGYQLSDVTKYIDEYKLKRPNGEVVLMREPAKFLVKVLI
ncbi:MAG: GNAT family N-acetyltransferase [Chloroflexota bacterium]